MTKKTIYDDYEKYKKITKNWYSLPDEITGAYHKNKVIIWELSNDEVFDFGLWLGFTIAKKLQEAKNDK